MANFDGELIQLAVFRPLSSVLTFSFNLSAAASQNIDVLVAKSWCAGKRIDLLWENPAGTTQVRIRRSQYSFCRFVTDPGVDIYIGPPITTFVDGPGDIPPSYTNFVQSTTPLDENRFYYYTIFLARDASAPFHWIWDASGEVEGLSIKDYMAVEGHYVYEWLPRTYRQRDADPSRGNDRYLLRDYCDVIQCGVSTIRGWCEGLLLLRDPDLMPAGRIGEALNQTGILEAQSWDLGMPPEKSFDAGVLRRIAMGMIPIYKIKGTCPGLVALTKLFTTWDSTCDELIESQCGVDRVFRLWDGVSKINNVVVSNPANNPTLNVGNVVLSTSTIFMADGVTADNIPDDTQGIPIVGFVLDGMGTFACVSSVGVAAAGNQTITFTDPNAKLRSSITGSGTGIAGQFTITSVDSSSFPWQFPSPAAAPKFDINAWGGYQLKDSGGNVFPITSSLATSGGTTVLNVTGTPASGAFTIAIGFSGGNPLFFARLYTGDFSLLYDPKWDLRLINSPQPGPFAFLTGLGATTINPAPTPADVIIWVENVAQVISTSTAITNGTLTDSAQTWTVNQWVGFYVIPNWDQARLFKIIANTTNQLVVDLSAPGGGITAVALSGNTYVILTEEDALKYFRLYKLLPSFLPHESRGFIKFT